MVASTTSPSGIRSIRTWVVSTSVFALLGALTVLVWSRQVEHQRSLLESRTEDVCIQAAKRLEVFLFGQRLIPPDQYTEVLIGGGPAKGIQLNGFAANPGDKFYFRHLRW